MLPAAFFLFDELLKIWPVRLKERAFNVKVWPTNQLAQEIFAENTLLATGRLLVKTSFY